jgi:TIR domain
MADPYGTVYSDTGKASRKELPPEALAVLLDVLDALAEDPDAFPGRVSAISRDGKTRLYKHPSPPLEITFEVDTLRRILYLLHFVVPKVSVTKPIFISYSHKDAEWLDKLKQFLRPLENKSLIRVWDDTEIRPGAEWLPEIRKALGAARVAVFLVTQDFLNSPFINNEELPALVDTATNQGCLIFWIAVKSSTVADSPLAKFQGAISPNTPLALLSEGEQAKVLLEIYEKMKVAVSFQ